VARATTELQHAGWRNYSHFLRDDGLLIGYVESDDLDAAQERVARTEVNARWQAAVASPFGREGAPDESVAAHPGGLQPRGPVGPD
jgi:L-rhamnose mutarotase